jgi:hypothetical protein
VPELRELERLLPREEGGTRLPQVRGHVDGREGEEGGGRGVTCVGLKGEVVRVGHVYLERDGDQIKLMLVDPTDRALISTTLPDFACEELFLTFGELLMEVYRAEYRRWAEEAKKLEEKIKELKEKGLDASPEERDLKRCKDEGLRSFKKFDALKSLLGEFKKILEEAEEVKGE